jgi:hypothetical protein
MKIKEEFFKLPKEKQEEEAIKMSKKYHKLADYWRRMTVLARQGKIKSEQAA